VRNNTVFKKLLCLFLCTALIVCLPGLTGLAAVSDNPEIEIEGEITDYPIVMLPGYSGCRLYYGDSPETGECAWAGVTLDELGPNLLKRIAEIGLGLGALPVGGAKLIAKVLGEEINRTWPYMACNPDGTSVYDLHPYYTTPETTNSQWLSDTDNDFCRHDREMAGIYEDYVGKENLFNFNIDWRMGAEDLANQLDSYIQAVKKYTGKDKVNIYAISHGGQIAATYLALYGDKMDADNVVLSSPAIGGSALASDLLLRQVNAQEQTIVKMVEQVTYTEEDYEWLLMATRLGFLDTILDELVPYVKDLMGYWPSIWDFVPSAKYEECKAMYLSSPESAPLVKQSDRFHYEILPTVGEKLRTCRERGMNISIVTGSGDRIASGSPDYSDAIIPVYSATGAYCPPYGEHFEDGYTQKNSCGGKNKISPDKTIDASAAYLPDNTWFSDGNYHAWTYFAENTKYLTARLVLTHTIKDVYSDPQFPQFLLSENPSKSLVYSFNGAVPGYIDKDTDALIVKNVMQKANLRVLAVKAKGADMKFSLKPFGVKIAPGETAEIPVAGIPAEQGKYVSVTVIYAMDNITPLNYRTIGFTISA
jgi:pimeloyl-ACP methyl ester carboxylesterase